MAAALEEHAETRLSEQDMVWLSPTRLCHPEQSMPSQPNPPDTAEAKTDRLVLCIDTCGPSGTVALARIVGTNLDVLGQAELAGRSYSATLVAAVGQLLSEAQMPLSLVQTIVAVNGPGSFTGVRVGLSAVKGLAEAGQIPVVAVSRLEVLTHKTAIPFAALDAHRGEVFLRIEQIGARTREILAGASELAAISPAPGRIAICDSGAETLLVSAWPHAELVHASPPTAADAVELALRRIVSRQFVDLALLDGHYLRRSDAEIFAPAATSPEKLT